MSAEAVSWVLRGNDGQCVVVNGDGHYVGRSAVLLVLLVLAEHADPEGRGACPSQRTIAAETGLERRAVQHALKQLQADGIIVERSPAIPRRRGAVIDLCGAGLGGDCTAESGDWTTGLGGDSTAETLSTESGLGGDSTAESDPNSAVHSAVHSAGIAPHEPEPEHVATTRDTHARGDQPDEERDAHHARQIWQAARDQARAGAA